MSLCRQLELQKTGIPSVGLVVGRRDSGEHMRTGCCHMSGQARRMERERRGTETEGRGQEILRESRKRQCQAGRPWAPCLSL